MTHQPLNYHKGAVYTVELGCLVENGFDLGLQHYPIFDETYREQLNRKIVEHYWFREIGQETPQLFKMFLNRTMNEIMPYYNELYKTAILELNPLANMEQWTTGDRKIKREETNQVNRTDDYTSHNTSEQTSNTTSDVDSTARTVNYAFPQLALSGNEDYATSATDADSSSNTTGASTANANVNDASQTNVDELANRNANDTDNYVEHVAGLVGMTQAAAVMQFRDAIINVDMMVIYALERCFMQLWTVDFGVI